MLRKRCIHWTMVLVLLLGVRAHSAPLSPSPLGLSMEIGDLQRGALRAKGISATLWHRGDAYDLVLRIRRLWLPGVEGVFKAVELNCPDAPARWPVLRCHQARLDLADSPWGAQRLRIDLDFDGDKTWRIGFAGLRLGGRRITGRASWNDGRWSLAARGKALRLARLPGVVALRRRLGLESLDARLDLRLNASGDAQAVRGLRARGRFRDLAFADAAGEQAAERLGGDFGLDIQRPGKAWRGRLTLDLSSGELYSDPVFLDFGKQPLKLSAKGAWQAPRLRLASLGLDAGGMLAVHGALTLDTRQRRVREGRVHIASRSLAALHRQLLQPVLADSRLADLELEGSATADLQWRRARLVALDARIPRLDLDQSGGGLGLNGVKATLAWRAAGQSPPSTFSLEGGHLGRLDFGATRATLVMNGASAWLDGPLEIPFYQGLVRLSPLTWVQTAQGPDVGFGLTLDGVQLEQLSTDLGWPRMRGAVSSRIPRARYHAGSLQVDGDLLVKAFDGSLRLRHLRLDELGSVAPVLQADVALRRLDLLKLTQTFSFGEIQGRLDGEVKGLQLVAWRPNRFDARLYTSPHDDRRHRISQRAVENLTELGNGVSGALSSSFLRFFKQFSYDRIELKLRQRGNTAWIDGIPAPEGGYYLVKGSGIPRIDVIGRNRKVAWSDLLARLQSIRLDGVRVQ